MSTSASIIIPTFNRAELLLKALHSVQGLRVPAAWDVEVLVIDNNCTDHTRDVVAESSRQGPLPIRLVHEPQQGLNNGRNRGLHEARHDHLVYLDDDMTVDPAWLESFAGVQQRLHPQAVVGPVVPEFEHPPPSWITPYILRKITSAYSQKGDREQLVDPAHAHELPGCNFGVLKRAAVEVGGFHPSLDRSGAALLAGGDFEFGRRLVRAGKPVAYAPGCRIRHWISAAKMSRDGLRTRWTSSGQTGRAFMILDGKELGLRTRVHLVGSLVKHSARMLRAQILGDDGEALRWELEAREVLGVLGRAPPGFG